MTRAASGRPRCRGSGRRRSAPAASSPRTSGCSPRSAETATRCTTTRRRASASRFGEIVVQGGVTSAILNAVVAEDLPGPGDGVPPRQLGVHSPGTPRGHDHRSRRGHRGAHRQADHEARDERPPPGRGRRPPGHRGLLHDAGRNVTTAAIARRTAGADLATAALTVVAMVLFAANSVLCRAALAGHHADAASFAAIRLAGGAFALAALSRARGGEHRPTSPSWPAAGVLFAYALAFSLAYLRLSAGTGRSAALRGGAADDDRGRAPAGRPAGSHGVARARAGGGRARRAHAAGARAARSPRRGADARRRRRVGPLPAARPGPRGRPRPQRGELRARLPDGARRARARARRRRGARGCAGRGARPRLRGARLRRGLHGLVRRAAAARGERGRSSSSVVPPLAAAGGVLALHEAFSPRLAVAGVLVLGGIALAFASRPLSGRPRP